MDPTPAGRTALATAAGQGVRRDAIRPRAVEGPSPKPRLAATGDCDKPHAAFTARHSVNRFGTPQKIAAMARGAPAFAAGRAFALDGGGSV